MFPYQRLADVPSGKDVVVLAQEKRTGGFAYHAFKNMGACNDFLLSCPPTNADAGSSSSSSSMHYYELIRDRAQRVYFDIDLELPPDEPIAEGGRLAEWTVRLNEFVDEVRTLLGARSVAVFDSTYPERRNKLSAHVVVLDRYVRSARHNALVAFHMRTHSTNTLADCIDMKVYKKNQLLRVQNSEKIGSGRPKRLASVVGDTRAVQKTSVLYFVQFVYGAAPVDMRIIDTDTLDKFDAQRRFFSVYAELR